MLCGDNVVMTDKVFTENNRDKYDVDFLKQLEDTFGHKVIIIPWHATGTLEDEEADVYGHADGFINIVAQIVFSWAIIVILKKMKLLRFVKYLKKTVIR